MRATHQLLTDAFARAVGWGTSEYHFHRTRRWRFDLAWPAEKIAVEWEGGSWTGGRHTRGTGFAADCWKYDEAAALGWRVFRFTYEMLQNEFDRCVALTCQALGRP